MEEKARTKEEHGRDTVTLSLSPPPPAAVAVVETQIICKRAAGMDVAAL